MYLRKDLTVGDDGNRPVSYRVGGRITIHPYNTMRHLFLESL